MDWSLFTTEDLEKAIVDIKTELASRSKEKAKLRISETFGSYNGRRYGRPWIARLTSWPVGGKPEMEFGRYLGDDAGGEVEIMAFPGDIIRTGQKDHRGGNTEATWKVVEDNGSLSDLDQKEARRLFTDQT